MQKHARDFLHLMFLYSHKSNNIIIMQNTTMSGDGF